MRWAELPVGDPPSLLAWEEALLDVVELGGEEILWFWESTTTFVVVGYGQAVEREVNLVECRARGVPVLRRSSGGGAVVQGPGCLNYGLALRTNDHPGLTSVTQANQWIMARNATALNRLVGGRASVQGHTDLALRGVDGVLRKFSGNAQRRTRNALLFHGTFLCDFDLSLVSDLLASPSAQPGYRANRPHAEFVTNLGQPPHAIREVLKVTWDAGERFLEWPSARHDQALIERYRRPEWHHRR
ncbi:MAG TPA: lipoate--protein ligase family protein [Verrucomicrobiota bacterium]|nr:lipoate--protein ligase family protein [Verrucomicrobiales bacterium]HRI12088.1 lipoate--protein ligase family protein [Verrucomicrobiota bacterium]